MTGAVDAPLSLLRFVMVGAAATDAMPRGAREKVARTERIAIVARFVLVSCLKGFFNVRQPDLRLLLIISGRKLCEQVSWKLTEG
jgi:hypothetical protein